MKYCKQFQIFFFAFLILIGVQSNAQKTSLYNAFIKGMDAQKAFLTYMANTLTLYFENPSEWQPQETLPLPDGSPIGSSLSCTQND